MKLFKFEIQKYAQILRAYKPYFLMPGHILHHCTELRSVVGYYVQL